MRLHTSTAAVLLLLAPAVHAICDICNVRNAHTAKDFSTPFEAPVSEFPACKYYQDAACCDQTTVADIAVGQTVYNSETEIYDFAACHADPAIGGNVSQACANFFEAQACFYECDVNLGKYRKHEQCDASDASNSWEIFRAPVKATYCDAWFEACKDDFFCVDSSTPGSDSYFGHAALNAAGECTLASGNCQTFADIYTNGTGMCDRLYGTAFFYDDSNSGFVFSFEAGSPNPNDEVHFDIIPPTPCADHDVDTSEAARAAECGTEPGFPDFTPLSCEACHLRNDHTNDLALATPGLAAPCAKYEANACCSVNTTTDIDNGVGLYSPEFAWDRCYTNHAEIAAARDANTTLSAAFARCDRWFKVEECFYECDVNAGKFRRHTDCSDGAVVNAWQIQGMPIRASECDAFYNDCKDLIMCTCVGDECTDGLVGSSLFGMANPGVCEDSDEFCQRTIGEVWQNSQQWCEQLWDNSFAYEQNERKAYTWAWNDTVLNVDDVVHADNPNNRVLPNSTYPEPCSWFDFAFGANGEALEPEELCTPEGVAIDRATLSQSGGDDSTTTSSADNGTTTGSADDVTATGTAAAETEEAAPAASSTSTAGWHAAFTVIAAAALLL